MGYFQHILTCPYYNFWKQNYKCHLWHKLPWWAIDL